MPSIRAKRQPHPPADAEPNGAPQDAANTPGPASESLAREADSNRHTVPDSRSIGRIPLLNVTPARPDNRWNPRAFSGEVVTFGATSFREGHDALGVELILVDPSGTETRRVMSPLGLGTDRFEAQFRLDTPGEWSFRVRAYADDFATWHHTASVKIDAGADVELMYLSGSRLAQRAAADTLRPEEQRRFFREISEQLSTRSADAETRRQLLDHPLLHSYLTDRPLTGIESTSDETILVVEGRSAGVGAWYEFFPRSEGAVKLADGGWQSGTFRSSTSGLDRAAAMGFDVVYLPPIHPIGRAFRKGPNNSLDAGPHDPGSPWAIGGIEGGHDAIHPDLGTEEDFTWFVAQATERGLAIALDLALQASPDHPWVTAHPEWFTTRDDGSIAYAENPPKKYQDIYPINFDNDPEGIRAEVLRIVRYWISLGVTIFRVDNPHTKPVNFWEWLLAEVRTTNPDVVFLAEAFTKPAMLTTLAKVGFHQSYSYFTWRNTKEELEEFFTSISTETVDYLRPNLFVNTPDILTEYLQFGGPSAFAIRAALAATAAPLWGMYAGYELFENVARPGSEENIDNEKYEYKPRNFERAAEEGKSLALFVGILNRARAEHPALRQLRNLVLQSTDDDAILAYSKHVSAELSPTGVADTVIVVANLDPHSVRETTVHLDLTTFGFSPGDTFVVTDAITGESWTWSDDNYVRLDAFVQPVHILAVSKATS